MRRGTGLVLAVVFLATTSTLVVDAATWLPGDTFVGITGGFQVIAPDGNLQETVDIPQLTDSLLCLNSDVRAIKYNPSTTPPSLWVACAGGDQAGLVIIDATSTVDGQRAVISSHFDETLDIAFDPDEASNVALVLISDGTSSFLLVYLGLELFFGVTLSETAEATGRLAVGPDTLFFYTTPNVPLGTPGQLITRWGEEDSGPGLRALIAGARNSSTLEALPVRTMRGLNGTTQRVRVMQSIQGELFGAIFPTGALARQMVVSGDEQFLLLAGENLSNNNNEQCVVAQPLVGIDEPTPSCADGLNLWSVTVGLPGQQAFFANTDDGQLFRFDSVGGDALQLWATSDAETTQTGLDVYEPWPLEPVCEASNFVGPGDDAWWGPYRPDSVTGGIDQSLSPVSWIDACAKEVELCQDDRGSTAPQSDCVCAAWRCLNPPVGIPPSTPPVCKSELPALRRFYCGLAKAADCSGFDDLPPLPASCDSLPVAAVAARRSRSRRALHAAA